jgi:threonine dehydrogenase-like Zn-dependent dehydrogenase
LGAGCIGLVTLMSLLARGIKEVYVTDLIELRLKKAEEIGALISLPFQKGGLLSFSIIVCKFKTSFIFYC